MRRLLPGAGGEAPALSADELVEAYRLPPGRALRGNFIPSLDGAVAVDGRSGGLGTPGDRQVFTALRALADVVLVGHGTAAAEGYRPMAADSPVGRLRTALGRPATAPVAVVSRRASLAPGDRLAVPPTILVTCAAADPARRAALAPGGVGLPGWGAGAGRRRRAGLRGGRRGPARRARRARRPRAGAGDVRGRAGAVPGRPRRR